MRLLQVEELEPRHLLNGAGFSPQPPPAPHPAAGPLPARVAEHSPLDLAGSQARPLSWERPAGGAETGPSRDLPPHAPDRPAPEASGRQR
jgi:hypothetical protein